MRADFTGDGKTDVGLLYNYGGGRTIMWVATSTGTGTGFNGPTPWWDSGASKWEWDRTKLV